MPFHTNQLGLGKRHWNLETSSAVVEFPPPYLDDDDDDEEFITQKDCFHKEFTKRIFVPRPLLGYHSRVKIRFLLGGVGPPCDEVLLCA